MKTLLFALTFSTLLTPLARAADAKSLVCGGIYTPAAPADATKSPARTLFPQAVGKFVDCPACRRTSLIAYVGGDNPIKTSDGLFTVFASAYEILAADGTVAKELLTVTVYNNKTQSVSIAGSNRLTGPNTDTASIEVQQAQEGDLAADLIYSCSIK